MRKLTTAEFIQKSKKIHGDLYDYSLTIYKNSKIKTVIKCPKHGVFIQRPNDHLSGHGCGMCGENIKLTTINFIKKALRMHKGIYDYSEVNYVYAHSKIKIKCFKHGFFIQSPGNHLFGQGCPNCAGRMCLTQDEFIKNASKMQDIV